MGVWGSMAWDGVAKDGRRAFNVEGVDCAILHLVGDHDKWRVLELGAFD